MTALSLSWTDFWAKSQTLGDLLRSEIKPGMNSLCIPSLAVHRGLLLLGAALTLGLDVVFDEKKFLNKGDDSSVLHGSEAAWQAFAKTWPAVDDHVDAFRLDSADGIPEDILAALNGRKFLFSSSGSTGASRSLAKSAQGLLCEARLLAELYELRPQSTIASLVRPFHIYGFLHSFLLPLSTASSVVFWSGQSSLPSLEGGFPVEPDLTLTVPAHWSVLNHLWSETRTPTLVSSGASFGQERAKELLGHRASFERYFEILGSTETGGIGYRRIDEEGFAFTPFAGIRLEQHSEGTMIHSPFLTPEASILSSDKFEVLEDHRFLHRGRADRVFKYGALRYTLDEVEAALRDVCQGCLVICVFEENTRLAQGGLLRAWIETETLSAGDTIALRLRYQSLGSRPFPQALHFLPRFPRDAQGKVSLHELQKLTSQENN